MKRPTGTPIAAPTNVDARFGQNASQNGVADEAAVASKVTVSDMRIKSRTMIV